jgi:hypothetical protein
MNGGDGLTTTATQHVEKPRAAVWPVDSEDVAVTIGEDGSTIQLVGTVPVLARLLSDALAQVEAIGHQGHGQ